MEVNAISGEGVSLAAFCSSHTSSSAPTFAVLRMLEGTSLPVHFTVCYGLKQRRTNMRHQCNWELVPKTGWVLSSLMSVSAFLPWEICSLQHSFPLYLSTSFLCRLQAGGSEVGAHRSPGVHLRQEMLHSTWALRVDKVPEAAPLQQDISLSGDETS